MGRHPTSGPWTELIHACADAHTMDGLLATTLPKIRRLVAADTTVVEVPGLEEVTLELVEGLHVPVGPVAAPTDGSRGVVLVPDSWHELGITHVVAQRLPGQRGVIAFGWDDAQEAAAATADLTSALGLLEVAVGRIAARADLVDLKGRVDNAQHLASMGDYDWHIATDTNQWSDELYRIYGHEPQAFNASYERFLGAIHPDDRERIQAVHQQAYATGEPYHMVERIMRPDGEVRYLSSNGEVVMDATGTPVRMRGTCIDISERVLAEQAREHDRARFRALVDASPEAILLVDRTDTVVLANPRAEELLGTDPGDHQLGEFLPQGRRGGQATPAHDHEGADLLLDVASVALDGPDAEDLVALFLADAQPRLEREAMATRLGESMQRRRQALEINDNVVQGLTAAVYALDGDDTRHARGYLERTLHAARAMMDDLLEPAGQQIRAGELIRTEPASLDAPTPVAEVIALEDGSAAVGVPRVLIVDDAEDIRLLLRLRLASNGAYDVVGEAADGLAAVEATRRLQPDVVLLDMAMPRMDGLQALPLILEAAPGAHVIVLSGFNQSTLEDEAIAAGADRYVVKGGSMRDLLDVIAEVVQAA
ncbi:MAG: response regulator [Marmoricola sp.]